MDHHQADFLKTLIGLLNFLCWVCAAFVVGFGEFQRMNSLFGAVVPGFLPIYPTNTLIVTGTLACCVCYVGVLGAMKENRCMLIMFYLLLFILILVELAMGILFMVYVTKLDSYLESDLMGSLEALRTAQPDTNKTLRDDFDALHYLFQCCGVRGEADWEGNAPVSCCSQEECDSAPFDTWSEGCLQKLRNWFSHNFRSTGAGVIALAILKLVCMCVTVPLLVLLRQNRLGYI
ncbi:leukocyte surface antigen CD53 [Gadus morhua]|uniref:leukocyte surface antigen CD53 n=1 Tax=Gadus morhua TaxID=8049 RepID=UPI0011B4B993|nr:leukocyte surface antigen CD53-like [Gadus morhua]XP_030227184.1 leukocyte surface antigen CD53-like [Gadus morhua]